MADENVLFGGRGGEQHKKESVLVLHLQSPTFQMRKRKIRLTIQAGLKMEVLIFKSRLI